MMRCNELESDLAELRAAYDLYFQGVDRLPPLKKHDLFKKGYAKLKGSQIRQTAAKFRIETIGQKLLTYERLWDRTLKEIENGTYKRDLAKLKRKDQRQHQKPKSADSDSAFDVDEDLDLSDLDDEGDGDLAAALAAAEAAAARPSAPAIRPVTSLAPAITPVTPPGGVKPLTGPVPAVTPLPPAGGVRLTPAIPVVTPAGGVRLTSAIPAVTPAGGVRSAPAIAAVGTRPPVVTPPLGLKPMTPAIPALTPPGGRPVAPKISSGNFPAAAPAVPARPATGMAPAFKPATPSRPPGPVAADGGLSDTKIKAIYDAYVMAKKRCGEDTRAVTLDSVSSSLKKQVPELMKSHNAKSVEFKVVIKDGKAVLRALPKE